MASPVIMAGIRTAAVINVGTATLAAFIGAGGLGDPIVSGLALSDTRLVLSGAIPAAVLALLVDAVLALAGAGHVSCRGGAGGLLRRTVFAIVPDRETIWANEQSRSHYRPGCPPTGVWRSSLSTITEGSCSKRRKRKPRPAPAEPWTMRRGDRPGTSCGRG